MSPLRGRSPWRPASWGDRMTRSPQSEPVGIKPAASRGHEHYARVSLVSSQEYRTLCGGKDCGVLHLAVRCHTQPRAGVHIVRQGSGGTRHTIPG
eukprot:1054199-Prymnesium_polylepis.2